MAWVQDVRSLNQTRVMLEYNAGFQAALAGLQESPGTWEVCLQVLLTLTSTLVCLTCHDWVMHRQHGDIA